MNRREDVGNSRIGDFTIDSCGNYEICDTKGYILIEGTIPFFKGLTWNRIKKVGKIFNGREFLKLDTDWINRPFPTLCDPFEFIAYNLRNETFIPVISITSESYFDGHCGLHGCDQKPCIFFRTCDVPALKNLEELCKDKFFDYSEYIGQHVEVLDGMVYRLVKTSLTESDSDSDSDSE